MHGGDVDAALLRTADLLEDEHGSGERRKTIRESVQISLLRGARNLEAVAQCYRHTSRNQVSQYRGELRRMGIPVRTDNEIRWLRESSILEGRESA